MAKMSEGSPYYYTPESDEDNWGTYTQYNVYSNKKHPNQELLCTTQSQENASLIVDALNHECDETREAAILKEALASG
jgi:hypothetical protein